MKIGQEVTEVLEVVPVFFYVKRYIRPKYARADGEGILIGTLPDRVIGKDISSESVIAQLTVGKYVYGVCNDNSTNTAKWDSRHRDDCRHGLLHARCKKNNFNEFDWLKGVFERIQSQKQKTPTSSCPQTGKPTAPNRNHFSTRRNWSDGYNTRI